MAPLRTWLRTYLYSHYYYEWPSGWAPRYNAVRGGSFSCSHAMSRMGALRNSEAVSRWGMELVTTRRSRQACSPRQQPLLSASALSLCSQVGGQNGARMTTPPCIELF